MGRTWFAIAIALALSMPSLAWSAPQEDTAAEDADESGEDADSEAESDDDDWDDDDEQPKLRLEWGGKIQADLRFRVQEKSVGSWYDRLTLPVGVDRNENLFGINMAAEYGDISVKAEVDFVLYGFAQDVTGLGALSRREKLDPYRFEAHSLYLQIDDLFVSGLDFRIGQQLVSWGVADQFNPTNNLNADDLEDVLLFGQQQGNFMVRADYWIDQVWSITGVLVPIFRPALLPRSGQLAVARTDRLPFVDEKLRHRTHAEQAAGFENPLGVSYPTIVTSVTPVLPEKSLENMQVGYRLGGTVLNQDVALSYYLGRHDFPVPFKNHTEQVLNRRCNPDNAAECIDGTLNTNVFLHYPRMHVYGFNMSGEITALKTLSNKLNGVGYRIEAALIVPKQSTMELTNDEIDLGGIIVPAGEYDYDGNATAGIGRRPIVIEDTPFPKWSIGFDYTFNETFYINTQWVHGLSDEFGAGDWITEGYTVRAGGVTTDPTATALNCAFLLDGTTCARETLKPRIGDYLVMGLDIRFDRQQALFRLFTIFDLTGVTETMYDEALGERVSKHHSMFTEQGFSAVIYPEFNYSFGNGLELGAGALWQIGKDHSKFGDPAAGGSLVWTRSRFTF